ncbi:hypothetical protein ND748_32465 [Frankia sp. AiPs1]|uniref:hypothetical protein n=1 Tax=Frankia sp. AiPs1 TaxID=573493 RepID=UPI0020438042|nr:hypothetical protein [Frankia sp. AiPs1]MCM3926373.1 hypothetical protein [Frankia sp. AiPs1]
MADVSVRFQVAGDSEIVLNLSTPQAVRLVEAIMRKVADAMAAPPVGGSGLGGPGAGGAGLGGPAMGADRSTVGSVWPDVNPGQNSFPPER